jgi:LmbE family N-acetylglucosaminyl deacetylase
MMTVKELGTIVFAGAHPDDEIFTAAGILAQAVLNGQRVACVTATKGEAGVQDTMRWPLEQLGEIREKEMAESLAELGVKEHAWLNYLDGGCADVPEAEAVERLRREVDKVQPDTILTFGPEGMTGHEDHKAVSRWVKLMVETMERPPLVLHAVNTVDQYEKYLKPADEHLNIFFNIEEPRVVRREECDIYFELPVAIRETKRRAFAAQPSQMERMLGVMAPGGVLSEGLSVESFIKAEEDGDE